MPVEPVPCLDLPWKSKENYHASEPWASRETTPVNRSPPGPKSMPAKHVSIECPTALSTRKSRENYASGARARKRLALDKRMERWKRLQDGPQVERMEWRKHLQDGGRIEWRKHLQDGAQVERPGPPWKRRENYAPQAKPMPWHGRAQKRKENYASGACAPGHAPEK